MFKILIADDNPLIRMGLKNMIKWNEYHAELVGEAGRGDEVLELIDNKDIDLLITDIRMPGKDGLYILNKVRNKYPDIRTIIISAYDEFEYAKQALKAGSIDYILKPIDPKELNDAIAKAINLKKGFSDLNYSVEHKGKFIFAVLKCRESYKLNELGSALVDFEKISIANEDDTFILSYHEEVYDFHNLKETLKNNIRGRYLFSSNPLLQAKLNSILENSFACYAAIAGGLNIDLAYNQKLKLIKEIDKSDNIVYIYQCMVDNTVTWAELVKNNNEKNYSSAVREAVEFISNNVYNRIALKDIIKNRHYSEKYFCNKFKFETGLGISQFIILSKITEAKLLLTARKTSLSETAAILGFCSDSYFSKCFKFHTSFTPKQFVNNYRTQKGLYNYSKLDVSSYACNTINLLYQNEILLYKSIKEGADNESVELLADNVIKSGEYYFSYNNFMNTLYLCVQIIFFSSRAAIIAGMHESTAFSMSYQYIQLCDTAKNAEEIIRITKQSIAAFLTEIRNLENLLISSEAILRAVEYINDHLHEKISLDDVAIQLDYSKVMLCQNFKKETGMTISDYILIEKIKAAKDLLTEKRMSITDTAYTLGFCSQSYFIRCFKKVMGYTPYQFTKKSKNDNQSIPYSWGN